MSDTPLPKQEEPVALKPCPCCAGPARCSEGDEYGYQRFKILCDQCGLSTASFSTAGVAIVRWNTRMPEEAAIDPAADSKRPSGGAPSLTDGHTDTRPSLDARMVGEPVADVHVKRMNLSGGRSDFFVAIKVGDREVTPHVFRDEYKAAYHVALYNWLLNGVGDEPDIVAFGPLDWPAQVTRPAAPPTPALDARMREGLVAAIRAAKLALFTINKHGVMPNSSWESGFNRDLKTAEDVFAIFSSPVQSGKAPP